MPATTTLSSLNRIGIDESGKGDYFGPLVIAAVFVTPTSEQDLALMQVRDSKKISDGRILELAPDIRLLCPHSIVAIGPQRYNELYAKIKNLNRLLAWGHARVIENLMLQQHRMLPPPVRAISDQFASDKATVAKALMSLGRQIELIQRHKAEADLAVAAASILARDEFVRRLAGLGAEIGVTLPKGASAAVDAVARQLVQNHGAEKLATVAKMHFRTALRAQGLPEPPKVPWRKSSASARD